MYNVHVVTKCFICDSTDKMPKGSEPPVFSKGLQKTTIVEKASVELSCRVSGTPEPQIEWYKDRKLIKSGRHYKMTRDGSKCTLTIQEAFLEDSGNYMCRAINVISSVTTEAELRVQRMYLHIRLLINNIRGVSLYSQFVDGTRIKHLAYYC